MTTLATPSAPPVAPQPVSAPAVDPRLYRLSVEQYLQMGRFGVLTADDHVELLDGYLVEKMTKHSPHIFATEALRVLDVPRDLPDLNPEPERESPADADDLSIADLGSGEPNVMEELAAQQSAPGAAVYASSDVVSADAAPAEAGPKVPNFRGKTMRAVVEEASAIGLPVLFDGSGIARAQVPAPGTVLHAGERVRVQFAR